MLWSNHILRGGLLALSAICLSSTAHAAIIIDQLSLFQKVFVPDGNVGGTGTIATGTRADVGDTFLGPDREMFVQRVSNAVSDNDVALTVAGGLLRYTSSDTTQGRGRVVYDGVSGDGVIANFGDAPDNYGLALDLSNFYKIRVVASTDSHSIPFSVTLYSTATKYATGSIVLQTVNGVPQNYAIYFANFTPVGDTLGNILSNVNALSLAFNANYSGEIGADATVSLLEFTQIPEPATLALVGLSLFGVTVLRRKLRA